MSIVIDVLFVIVLGLFIFFFTKLGFAHTMKKIGKTWLSFFCSAILGPMVAGKLEALIVRSAITDGVYKSLVTIIEKNENGYNLAELFEHLPEKFTKTLAGLGASLKVLEAEYGSYSEAGDEILHAMASRIADPCINVVSSMIGHIICFFVPLLFFWWINFEVEKRRIPFFRAMDHIGGFLSGTVCGYVCIVSLAALLYTSFQVVIVFHSHSSVMSIYDESFLFKFLNEFDTLQFLKNMLGYLT